MHGTLPARSGRFSINHSMRRLNPGSLSTTPGSSDSTANNGTRPTIDRIFIGTCAPVRHVQHVVEESVLFAPHAAVAAQMC